MNREPCMLEIEDKEIWYSDRFWKRKIRLIPKDKEFLLKIKTSRNKIPHKLIEFFNLTPREQKEYDDANTEEELAMICIKDVREKGAVIVLDEVVN